jgi:hypothetical protein
MPSAYSVGAKFLPSLLLKTALCPVDIASTSGTEDPGSNPDRVQVLKKNIAMLLCTIDIMYIHTLFVLLLQK